VRLLRALWPRLLRGLEMDLVHRRQSDATCKRDGLGLQLPRRDRTDVGWSCPALILRPAPEPKRSEERVWQVLCGDVQPPSAHPDGIRFD
jgi:hypothetical protein